MDDERGAMKNPLTEYGLFGWNYAYLLLHPWVIAEESYYRIKWFIQRGYRGFADRDVWDLESYLAGWMPAALRRLENNKVGHPCGMTQRGWNTRLRIMREGFEAAKAMDDVAGIDESVELQRRVEKGLKMFAAHYLSLWD